MVTNLFVQANLLCGKIAWNGYGYVSLRILIFFKKQVASSIEQEFESHVNPAEFDYSTKCHRRKK